jgi:hypothetical protein
VAANAAVVLVGSNDSCTCTCQTSKCSSNQSCGVVNDCRSAGAGTTIIAS